VFGDSGNSAQRSVDAVLTRALTPRFRLGRALVFFATCQHAKACIGKAIHPLSFAHCRYSVSGQTIPCEPRLRRRDLEDARAGTRIEHGDAVDIHVKTMRDGIALRNG